MSKKLAIFKTKPIHANSFCNVHVLCWI